MRFAGLGLDTVFFVNSGAEANENALKMAFRMTGRCEVVALEHGFHGRTAAAGALTWGAAQTWYGFPRTPFDVSFIPRDNLTGISAITERTAAVVVEPIQGVGGAFDVGAEYLKALRQRCDATGTVLIFDEVHCGMGRTGYPYAANMYGVTPDMITTAKALGNGFPCAAVMMSDQVAAAVRMDALGTTFGAGPLACAAIEAVIEAIESENLLEQVRRVSYVRKTCIVRTRDRPPGREAISPDCAPAVPPRTCSAQLARNILAGTSGDPHILRLLSAFILTEEHVDLLRAALLSLPK